MKAQINSSGDTQDQNASPSLLQKMVGGNMNIKSKKQNELESDGDGTFAHRMEMSTTGYTTTGKKNLFAGAQ